MRVIQALHWSRNALAHGRDYNRILRRLHAVLVDKKQGPVITADLIAGFPTLPAWMQDILRQLLTGLHDEVRDGAAAGSGLRQPRQEVRETHA